jgi:hypothetical protein
LSEKRDRCGTLALEPPSTYPLGKSLHRLATADHPLEPAAEALNRLYPTIAVYPQPLEYRRAM